MITIMSLWRNDVNRALDDRVHHLLSKTSLNHSITWLWVVGDSEDETENLLRMYTVSDERVTVICRNSGDVGEDTPTRRTRIAWTASKMFAEISMQADYVCLHESDLLSPENVLDLLLAVDPMAAWPVILFDPPRFYDIYAFRDVDGDRFDAFISRPSEPFRVSSFGSCWMAKASLVRNRVIGAECIVDLCRQWREEGHQLYVDPRVTVVQPISLWNAA